VWGEFIVENTDKHHSILIVDDEPSILKALQRLLSDEDYGVFTASSYKETMELLSKHTFSVIITDFKMPGICGDTLLGIVKVKCPDTFRVMLSGASDSWSVPATIADGILHCQIFMTKPWNDQELLRTIRKCIVEYETAVENHSNT
jgi:DNA-binding NtrC family response regulator